MVQGVGCSRKVPGKGGAGDERRICVVKSNAQRGITLGATEECGVDQGAPGFIEPRDKSVAVCKDDVESIPIVSSIKCPGSSGKIGGFRPRYTRRLPNYVGW